MFRCPLQITTAVPGLIPVIASVIGLMRVTATPSVAA